MKSIFEVKILGIVAAIGVVLYALFSHFFPDTGLDNLKPSDRLNMKKNIIVLGVDERAEEYDAGRSDTLFVVMFDSKTKSASLLSVPRDTRVRIKKMAGIKSTTLILMAVASLPRLLRRSFWE